MFKNKLPVRRRNWIFAGVLIVPLVVSNALNAVPSQITQVRVIARYPDGTATLAWSRDGRFVRVDPSDRRRQLQWDTTYFEVKTARRVKLESLQAQRLFGKSPFYFASNARRNRAEVSVCSAKTGKCVPLQNQPRELHRLVLYFEPEFYQPSRDGREIQTASGGEVRVWSTLTGALIRRVRIQTVENYEKRFTPRLSRDGKWLIARGARGTGIFNASTGKLRFLIPLRSDEMSDFGFSPSGRVFFVAVPNQDFQSCTHLFKSTSDGRTLWKFRSSSFASPAFSPTENLVALSGAKGLELYDPSNGKLKKRLAGNSKSESLAFSPSGSTIWSSQSLDNSGFSPILSWRLR